MRPSIETYEASESIWQAHAMQGWRCSCREKAKVSEGHGHQHPRHPICQPGVKTYSATYIMRFRIPQP